MLARVQRSYSPHVSRLTSIELIYSVRREFKSTSRPNAPKLVSSKTLAELPSVYTRPDGTPAPPLTEWRSSADATSRSSVAFSDTIAQSNCGDSKKSKSKKKRTSKKAEPLTDTETLSKTPKRRTRAARSTALPAEQGEETETISAPKNQLAQLIIENREKYPNAILLTRVGQFYESYFDQAIEVSQLLDIKLASRRWNGQRIHMCGFPLFHLDRYLKVLVDRHGRSVALCEEFSRQANYSTAKEFDRRVVRVVTPGTLIDETFLNPDENNYLLSIGLHDPESGETELGLAWTDISTGEFLTKPSSFERLRDDLVRISPREVVLDHRFQGQADHQIFKILSEETGPTITYATPSDKEGTLPLDVTDLTLGELTATSLITTFLQEHLLEHMPRLSSPSRDVGEQKMQIESQTFKALEIREGMIEGGTRGSLMSAIKRTTTKGGARLLARWLSAPSTSIKEITDRQSIVSLLVHRQHLRSDLTQLLKQLEDSGRIVQKFLTNRGDVSDLLSLGRTIRLWGTIRGRILEERASDPSEAGDQPWTSLLALLSQLHDLKPLSTKISDAVQSESVTEDDQPGSEDNQVEGKVEQQYGQREWAIKPSFSEQLSNLHATYSHLLGQREEMERSLQSHYGAPTLTLRSSPPHGMHVHISRTKRKQALLKDVEGFVQLSETGSTRTYFHQPWSLLGARIDEVSFSIEQLEKQAFASLRTEVINCAGSLHRNAQIMDELDVTLSFATLACEMKYVKPVITDDTSYNVVDGRHPTVQQGLFSTGRTFVPNSINLTPRSRLHIITGPNMAGKSTVLRQTALIAILAQIGSFVPAEEATIGIVDRLFSRVGAKDDLFHNRSTFMVEMLETAEILRRATPKSLVIMDEVGRGTTVKDGLSIAYATVHHLATVNGCRALFATHFHELADLAGYQSDRRKRSVFKSVDFFCTTVVETKDDHFAYSYRLQPGVNRDSHGLKVAHLAGMPAAAMEIAKETIDALKSKQLVRLPLSIPKKTR